MSRFEASTEQKEQYFNRGYTSFPGALPPELLERWQQLAQRLESEAMEAHRNDVLHQTACVVNDPVGDRLMRHNDIIEKDPDAVLDLLACPAMIAIARDLCGQNAVPMQVDIVYKHQHPHPVIIWHQGAQHPRNYPYLNVGVYLDDAGPGDGCLRYIDNTQHEQQDIQGLSEKHGWDIPGVVELPAKAGDILVQDMMILHGSQPKRTPGVRRTIYIEIRPVEGILESETQSKEWAEFRRRLMGLVLRRATPSDWPEEWISEMPTDLGSDEEEIKAIMEIRQPPIPAYYSIKRVITENYPVPADMQNGTWDY